MVKKVKRKKKLTTEEKKLLKQKRDQRLKEIQSIRLRKAYHNSIESIFLSSGFKSLPVENNYFKVGHRERCELDHCFVYENIIILCENTTGNRNSDHLLKKQEMASVIVDNKEEFLNFLHSVFSDKFNKNEFSVQRWKISQLLYFSKERIDFDKSDEDRYKNIKYIEIGTYNYFLSLSKCIKNSFKYELFRFLGYDENDIGNTSPGEVQMLSTRQIAIIYPNSVTGLNQDVAIVSFMMSPSELIKHSYVLRKDNWEESIGLYQRLITDKRIKNIRKFIINTQRTFINNVIVGLPNNVSILNQDGNEINISEIDNYENCKLRINSGFNSLSIIDGQHRIYAYYESDVNDDDEIAISKLRDKLNLLVTGIIFPKSWEETEKRKFQSDLFLQINKNSKNVDKDVLLHIESTKDPFSSQSIARQVLVKMNKKQPFKDMFELSLVEKSQIKVSSIIQYALSSLVNPNVMTPGLYKYWKLARSEMISDNLSNEKDLHDYIDFCVSSLCTYFSAIKNVYSDYWTDEKSQILRVLSVNGFLIAFHTTLKLTEGVKDFESYKSVFSNKLIDFSREKFPYSGSRYSLFATEKIIPLFYEEYEEKYMSLTKLNVDDIVVFNNTNIQARFDGYRFEYENSMFGLYDLTRRLLENEKTLLSSDNAGNYWKKDTKTLHQMFEENY